MTGHGRWRHDLGMDLPAPLAWLVDEAGAAPALTGSWPSSAAGYWPTACR